MSIIFLNNLPEIIITNTILLISLILIIVIITSSKNKNIEKSQYRDISKSDTSISPYFLMLIPIMLAITILYSDISNITYIKTNQKEIDNLQIKVNSVIQKLPDNIEVKYDYNLLEFNILISSEDPIDDDNIIQIVNNYTNIERQFNIEFPDIKISTPDKNVIITDKIANSIEACMTTNGYILDGNFDNGQAYLTVCDNLQEKEIEVADATYDRYTMGELKSINIK